MNYKSTPVDRKPKTEYSSRPCLLHARVCIVDGGEVLIAKREASETDCVLSYQAKCVCARQRVAVQEARVQINGLEGSLRV